MSVAGSRKLKRDPNFVHSIVHKQWCKSKDKKLPHISVEIEEKKHENVRREHQSLCEWGLKITLNICGRAPTKNVMLRIMRNSLFEPSSQPFYHFPGSVFPFFFPPFRNQYPTCFVKPQTVVCSMLFYCPLARAPAGDSLCDTVWRLATIVKVGQRAVWPSARWIGRLAVRLANSMCGPILGLLSLRDASSNSRFDPDPGVW